MSHKRSPHRWLPVLAACALAAAPIPLQAQDVDRETVRLLDAGRGVIGVDNFVRGTRENLKHALAKPGFTLIEADLADPEESHAALAPILEKVAVETVWHMAANSDILAGVNDRPSPGLADRKRFHEICPGFDCPVMQSPQI